MKVKQYNTCLFLLLCIISSTYQWDYSLAGMNWPKTCQYTSSNKLQAPIDIALPFTYYKPSITFSYSKMQTEYLFYNDGNNLILEGDFGYMTYNDVNYFTSQLHFYSPSTHTVNNHRYPLEMQVLHNDKDGNLLTVCVLFKASDADYSTLLGKLHFDNESLRKMQPYVQKTIKEGINIGKYIHDKQDFFIYDAVEMIPPCKKDNKVLILTDIINVSKRQLDNFPLIIKGNNRVVQHRYDRPIYLTFDYEKNVEKKLKANHDVVNANLNRLVEENKIKLTEQIEEMKASNKLKNNVNAAVNVNININEKNKTPEEVEKELELQLQSINKLNGVNETEEAMRIEKEKEESCKLGKKELPFDVVMERAVTKDTKNKKVELKMLGNGISSGNNAKNKTMVIDKDLPLTEDFTRSEELKEKYKKWKELKKKIASSDDLHPNILLQFNVIENELKNANYLPYIKHKQSSFDSFIQKEVIYSDDNNDETNNDINNLRGRTKRILKKSQYISTNTNNNVNIHTPSNKINEIADNIYSHYKRSVNNNNDNINEQNELTQHNSPSHSLNFTLYYELLRSMLFEIQTEYITLDKDNILNGTYYPRLTADNQIKISHYTFKSLIKFIYSTMVFPIPHDEMYSMLKQYALYILDKQNTYYEYNHLTPVEETNPLPNKQVLHSFTNEINETDKEGLETMIKNLFKVKTLIKLIDPLSENIEGYHSYNANVIDYIALEYLKDKKIKQVKRNTNIVGNRSQGRKASDKNGKQTKREKQLSFTSPELYDNNCKEYLYQSPINIIGPFIAENHKLHFNFTTPKKHITIINDGYKLLIKGHFGSFTHNQITYHAHQIHIHYPSEHTYGENETRADFEIQIIGKSKHDSQTAAIAVLFKYSKHKNELLSAFGFDMDNSLYALKLRNEGQIDIHKKNVLDKLNLNKVVGKGLHFASYIGSLTSPPCDTNVKWFVMEEKMNVSRIQVEYFKVLFGKESNVRKLQLLNNRIVSVM